MAEKFKLTENFTPNTEKRAIFRPTENFQFSDEIKKKWATADAESHAKKALSGIAENVSTELKSGIANSKAIAKSKPFNAYVSGNPIPHINPQGGVIGTKKEAEEYAKKATASDGFEGLSLEELKKRLDSEKEVYERTKGNVVTNVLDFIGSDWFSKNNSFNKTEEYKNQYKALKNAYENRKAAYTDYEVSKKYGVGSAEEAIELLKKRQKETKSDTVKRNLDEEIKTIREGLYGKGSIVKANVKGLTDTGFKQFLSLQAKTMDATLGNVARAFGFKNNVFSQTNDYYRNLYEQSHREQERLAKGAGDKYNISGSLGEGVSAALPDAAASSVIAILTGGASVAPQLGKAATGIRAALQTSIKSMAKNPFYWSSFVQTYGSDFEDAKSSGANDAVASLYAVLNSSLNAAIEVGGGTGNAGIQSLPEALKNAVGNKSAVMEWVKSALDEGKEEVIQGVITQLNTGLFFDRNKAIYSNTDENAAFNPSRMLQEGAMGAAVGAVLGAGQMTIAAISNAAVSSEWRAIGETVGKSGIKADELAEFAAKSLDTETRALGINSLNSKSISTETIGKLYSYACRSISTDILLPENINEASENFNKIMDGTDSKSIQDIASACFVTKLMQLGIDEESAEYMASGGVTTAENTDLQSTAKVEDHSEVLHEPETKNIAEKYDFYDTVNAKFSGKPAKTSQHRHIEKVSNTVGLNVSWNEKVSRGKYIPSERRIVLNPNLKTSEMYNFVFKHEFTHSLETKKGYDGFKDYVFKNSSLFEQWARERLEKSGFDSKGSREKIIKRLTQAEFEAYRNSDELSKIMRDRFTMQNAEAEVLADFVGENLLGTGDRLDMTIAELERIKTSNPGIIQRIRDFIRDMINRFKGNKKFGSLVNDLEYLNSRLEKVMRSKDKKTSDNQTEKFSIAYTTDNKPVAVIDEDILDGVPKSQWIQTVKDTISSKFSDGIPISGRLIKVNKITRSEYTNSKYSKFLKSSDGTMYQDKLKTANNLDDVVLASANYINEDLKHSRKDSFKEFARGDVLVRVGGNDYSAKVIVGFTNSRQMVLYDVVDFNKTAFKIKKRASQTAMQNAGSDRNGMPYDITVPQNEQSVNTYSTQKGEKNTADKQKQLEIINSNNPAPNEYSTWVRSEDDIKTFEETLHDPEWAEYDEYNPDFTKQMAESALKNGEIKVYSSYPIEQGVFVSPSRMEAESYSGNGKVYEKTVRLSDVAWIDPTQGQYANISENTQNDTEEHSIAALPVDELLDLYDKGEISRDEYLVATDTHSKHLAFEYIKKWDKETGNILQNKKKLEEERAKAVEAEREAQAEKKDRQSNINNIRRTVRKIDHALRANAHSKHIPEAYRKAATEFCKIFVDNDQATFTHKELADIRAYYNELKGKAENADAPQYDPMVDEWLQALLETVDGKKLTELDTDELFIVKNLTDAFNYQLDHEAEVFLENKKIGYTEVGNAAVEDLSKIKTVFFGKAWNNKDLEKWRGFLYEGNMTPAYFMKRMGPTFEKIYNMLVEGQGRWARNMQTSKEFVTGRMEAYEYDKWKNKTVEFRTESGRTLTLSVNQAMQLVATAQREQSNNGQTSKHLCLGGVVIDTEVLKTALKKNEKVDKIKGKDAAETLKKQNDEVNEILDSLRARAVQMTFEDVKVVESLLTEQQKGYMKDMVDYLSTQCAAWGNEVTMKLYGYRQFLETNYFPYVSSDVFLAKDPARADNTILKSASFTKSLQKNASNPLMLSSFTDVALQHIESMCNYNAVTVPLDTLNKMFNYQVKGADGQAITSVKSEITNKFGNQAVKYMQNFITDLNTGIRGDQRDSVLNSLSSKFKKSAVLANISVVLQQPSAIFRGLRDIDGKYYLKASKYYSKNNYEECKQYAGVAVIKEMGRFDTGMGVKNTSWLSNESTFREKLDDKLGAAAGKADEVAWSFLWSAVKAEIADTTDLKVGSDEFLTKAGERFTQLVNETQVYDSVLVKSQNMRSKSLLGAITSFAAEPTLAVNMLVNSYVVFKEGKKGSGKRLARTVMSLLVTNIVNSALKSLVTAARDDDEDKSYIEKYLGDLVSNSLSELSLFAKIPYLRDLKSLYDGYNIERQDTAVFADLIEAIKATGSESKTPMEKIRKLAEAAANIFGVPLKNVLRDAEAIARTLWNFAFDDITDENGKKKPVFHFGEETTADGIKVSMLEGISENNILKPWHIDGFDYSKSGEYNRMAKALERGDEKTYQKSYTRLTKDGAEDSDIRTGVLKQFKDDKSVKKQADGYLKELKKSGTYKSLSADDKEKLGKDITTALAKEKMVNAQEHKPTEYERLYKLFCTDKAGYKALRAEMLKSGKTEKQIKDGFEIAQYAYLQSIGIDLHKYLLYKLSASAKYADTDGSGGVSKTEKKEALNNMDIDEKTRRQIRRYLLENNY